MRNTMSTWRRWAPALVLALVASACGTRLTNSEIENAAYGSRSVGSAADATGPGRGDATASGASSDATATTIAGGAGGAAGTGASSGAAGTGADGTEAGWLLGLPASEANRRYAGSTDPRDVEAHGSHRRSHSRRDRCDQISCSGLDRSGVNQYARRPTRRGWDRRPSRSRTGLRHTSTNDSRLR